MRVQCTGKVVRRTQRIAKNGKTYYSIVIDESGATFARHFEFSSEDASLFGPADGFAAVGRTVTAVAFANADVREFVGKDGKRHLAYGVRFRLTDLSGDGDAPRQITAAVGDGDGNATIEDCI